MTTALQPSTQTGQHFECIATCDELRAVPELRSEKRAKSGWPGLGALRSPGEDWLHPLELVELARLRDARRRESWLFGRWVAKQLVLQALDSSPDDLSSVAVTTRNEAGESVRPTILMDNEVLPWSLSISHGERLVAAFLETDSNATIGIDIVSRESLAAGFQTAWFTANEQKWVSSADADAACIVWGSKEAVYKAANNGERFAPRKFEISPDAAGNLTARYCGRELVCEIESRVFADDLIVMAKYAGVRQ